MPICAACKTEYNPQTALERAAALLPAGIELYDFGGGITIAPMPDLRTDGQRNLASHMAMLVEMPCDGHKTKMLVFEIKEATWQRSTRDFSEGIADDLKRALSLWDTKAVSWDNANYTDPV